MKNICVIILLFLLSLVAISPLYVDSWYWAHDSNTHLVRVNDVAFQMSAGDFYPRWLPLSCLGKGSPSLNFYAPGFYLVTNYLHCLGIPLLASLKLVCFGCFFLGACGMLLWLQRHLGTVAATLSAVIYLFAPYHLLDIYVRGALPEFAGIAVLPFLFHAIDLSISPDRSRKGIVLTTFFSALIVLLHNLSALMIFPFALVYFLLQSLRQGLPAKRFLAAFWGPILGAGISAFYWLPLILEAKHLRNLDWVKSGVYAYQQHFLGVPQLFNTSWGFQPFTPPPAGMSFQLGHIILFCSCVGALALLRAKEKRAFPLLLLSLGLASTFLTLSYSALFYRLFPIFAYIQFPWRFLGAAALFLSAFCGTAINFVPRKGASACPAAFIAIVIVASVWISTDQRKVVKELSLPLEEEAFRKDGQHIFTAWTEDDYLPRYVKLSPKAVLEGPVQVRKEGAARIADYETRGSRMTLAVAGAGSSSIVVPWLYFPGWKAQCDGAEVPVGYTEEGLISVGVPAGRHTLDVWFGTTWPRITGWVIAVLSVVGSVAIYRRGSPAGYPFS